jgi:hypothetical protein
MPVTIGGGLKFCGRELKPGDLDLIRQTTRDFATLSLTELAHTVCELLEWRRPNGGLKSRECFLFLQALHQRGWLPWLSVPPRKLRPRVAEWDQHSDAQSAITGPIGDYLPAQLQLLDGRDDRRLFRQYLQRYHPATCWPACCSPAPPGKWRRGMPTSVGVQQPAKPTCP